MGIIRCKTSGIVIYPEKTNTNPQSPTLTARSCHMAESFQIFSASDHLLGSRDILILKLCSQSHGSFQAKHILPRPHEIIYFKPKQ